MSATKRALLIGSRTGDLQGTENDVEMMAGVLEKYRFKVRRCIGFNATRDGILSEWQALISASSADDAVVIYYSGHGAVVEYYEPDEQRDHHQKNSKKYIVPTDIEQSTEDDFRGILDFEMSHMLRDTTEKTRNVTMILDCCFSSRMVRGPGHGIKLVSKYWPTTKNYNITKHVKGLRLDEKFQRNLLVEGNPDAVRIAAAATTEKAYEYVNQQGQIVGLLTDTLAGAINETIGKEVSWRTTLLRVCEIVHTKFSDPQYLQHPQAEGPDTRILFSTEEMVSGAKLIKMEKDEAILQAGSVAGVREANIYAIMPYGCERIDSKTQIAKAEVIQISGFKSKVELTFTTSEKSIPSKGALAFLETEAPYRWPVSFPADFHALRERLEKSKVLRTYDANEKNPPLVNFQHEGNKILMRNSRGTPFSLQQAASDTTSLQNLVDAAVLSAENLALAQNILTCQGGIGGEALEHSVDIKFGLVSEGREAEISTTNAAILDGQRIFISLHNKGDTTIFLSVFDVNAAGDIALVSKSCPRGIELTRNKRHTLGELYGRLIGLKLSWPKNVPKSESIEETLVLVLTSSAVDLRPLTDQRLPNSESSREGVISKFLETNTRGGLICYAVRHISFLLCSRL